MDKPWAEILKLTVQDSMSDHAHRWAAAVAYYALMSMFPLALMLVSLSTYFVDAGLAISKVTDFFGPDFPQTDRLIQRAIQEAYRSRATASVVSGLLLLWTGTRVFAVLTVALNIVYGVKESYSFLRRITVETIMLCSVVILFLIASSVGLIVKMAGSGQALAHGLVWVVQAGLLLGVFWAMYRFLPRGKQQWKDALVGAFAATGLFLVLRQFFGYVLRQLLSYNLVYGSLAAIIIFLVWAWAVALITLFGGELASHYRMMVVERRSAESIRRLHARWSPPEKIHPEK